MRFVPVKSSNSWIPCLAGRAGRAKVSVHATRIKISPARADGSALAERTVVASSRTKIHCACGGGLVARIDRPDICSGRGCRSRAELPQYFGVCEQLYQ